MFLRAGHVGPTCSKASVSLAIGVPPMLLRERYEHRKCSARDFSATPASGASRYCLHPARLE